MTTFFFWVAFLACDPRTPSRTPLEGGTLWTPVEEAGEGTPVEEEGEETSSRITCFATFFLLYGNGFGNCMLNFLASNILSVLPFNFFLLCLTFSLSLSFISPVSSADNCYGLFLNLNIFEAINLTASIKTCQSFSFSNSYSLFSRFVTIFF